MLEDYDKGTDLREVARDFELIRTLGATSWRGSFGWDDYEPSRGGYDFGWLRRFAQLARRRGIRLRPYLAYTPEWAAAGRTTDGRVWNDPPARSTDFARFAARVASALRPYGSVASYEIYNEENTALWWDGTVDEYAAAYAEAAESLRAAAAGLAVLPGGLVWPDAGWLAEVCEATGGPAPIAAAPVHVYAETWTPESVTVERAVDDLRGPAFIAAVDGACKGPPIWANEIAFATARGKGERDQADWWVRAIGSLAADRRVEQIGIYEIRDLDPASPAIGEAENYHLGLTRADRTPKLAFHTVGMLVRLLEGVIEVRDPELRVRARDSNAVRPEAHLFRRRDGRQVLIAWVRRGGAPVTVDVGLPGGVRAVSYALDGSSTPLPLSGRTIRGLSIAPGSPRVVVIEPWVPESVGSHSPRKHGEHGGGTEDLRWCAVHPAVSSVQPSVPSVLPW